MPIRNERGLTLAEVLAAMLILGIVVALFLQLSGFTLRVNKDTSDELTARQIAENYLNAFRANPSAFQPFPLVVPEGRFTVVIQKSDFGTSPVLPSELPDKRLALQAAVLLNNEAKMITVTVAWGG